MSGAEKSRLREAEERVETARQTVKEVSDAWTAAAPSDHFEEEYQAAHRDLAFAKRDLRRVRAEVED